MLTLSGSSGAGGVNLVQGELITATVPRGWPTSTKVAALELVHVSRVRIGRIVVVTMHVPWQVQPLRNCRMPGHEIWSGSKAHPFDAETLPVLESWRDGIVAFEIGDSAFWRIPSLHDTFRPVDWAQPLDSGDAVEFVPRFSPRGPEVPLR